MNTRKILFLVVCLCISTAIHAQIRLSFNPTMGETYSYRFISEAQITQAVMGMEMPINLTTDMLIEMTVVEKNDNEIRFDYSYQSIAMQFSMPMMNFNFNSETDIATLSGAEREIAGMFSALIGKPMSVVFGTDGSVKYISDFGLDVTNPMMAAFQGQFSEDAMRQMFENTFNIYPNKEVRIGDSWSNNATFAVQGMNTDTKTTYTLRSITGNIATLDVVSVSTTTETEAANQILAELSIELTGETKLDITTGMIINSTMTGNMGGTFQTEGMEMTMNATSKMTVTLEQ